MSEGNPLCWFVHHVFVQDPDYMNFIAASYSNGNIYLMPFHAILLRPCPFCPHMFYRREIILVHVVTVSVFHLVSTSQGLVCGPHVARCHTSWTPAHSHVHAEAHQAGQLASVINAPHEGGDYIELSTCPLKYYNFFGTGTLVSSLRFDIHCTVFLLVYFSMLR